MTYSYDDLACGTTVDDIGEKDTAAPLLRQLLSQRLHLSAVGKDGRCCTAEDGLGGRARLLRWDWWSVSQERAPPPHPLYSYIVCLTTPSPSFILFLLRILRGVQCAMNVQVLSGVWVANPGLCGNVERAE